MLAAAHRAILFWQQDINKYLETKMQKVALKLSIGLGSMLLFLCGQISVAQTAPLNFKVTPLSEKIINGPISLARQGSFFVGGKDIESNTFSSIAI